MVTSATLTQSGLEVTFADGRHGMIPAEVVFANNQVSTVEDLKIPNPFVVQVLLSTKETIEIPWDFARHYCDPTYAARVERMRDVGQAGLGKRIQRLRSATIPETWTRLPACRTREENAFDVPSALEAAGNCAPGSACS